jgi:tripartite-type tricarboxylate transporter receptor subunit TctC
VDVAARLVAEGLRARLDGATVLVENKPGAGGTIAAADVARSAPDGYSLFVGFNGPLATAEHVFAKLGYKPLESFAPVIATVSQPHVLVVNANDPARTLGEFVTRVKATPGKANYASVGNASASHLTMELFKSAAGLFIVHIPYNGGPAATRGLISGDVDALFTAYVNVQGPVQAGRLRVLALAEAKRSPRLPEVPTFAEQGLAQVDAALWNAIVAPAGTPPEIVTRLNREIDAVLAEPAVREKLAGGGMDVIGGPPARLAQMMQNESRKWLPVIRRLGIKPD